MAETLVAKRYAEALIRLAKTEEEQIKIENDIEFIIKTLEADRRLVKIFVHPKIKRERKIDLIDKLWKPYVCQIVYNFMKLLVIKRRIYEIEEILEQYHLEVKKLKGIYIAEVHTAIPLSDDYKTKLKNQLEKISNLKIEIENKIKPEIIGGVLVRIGDNVIDGRVSRMLHVLNEKLRRDELIGVMDSEPELARVVDVEKE